MEQKEESVLLYARLRELVEKTVGYEMRTPKGFDNLSKAIFERTHEQISSFTLKRFWGYITRGGVSSSTLNILCHFIGVYNWETFCKLKDGKSNESGFIYDTALESKDLNIDDQIVLSWFPNREVTVKYIGEGMFTITKSINSKLQVGGTFQCSIFIANQPLILHNLKYDGIEPSNYCCGCNHGIQFRRL